MSPAALPVVYLVGGRKDSPFCDVYAERECAVAAVREYLNDPYWFGKTPANLQRQLKVILEHGEFDDALSFYNAHCGVDNQWHISEKRVRYPNGKASE